jgi:heat shock protein HslJ
MKIHLLLFSLLMLGIISCKTATKNNALNTVEKTFWINSAKLPCHGVGPMSCLQVQDGEKIEEGRWQNFFSNIEGFEYEPGNIYKIVVAVEQLPPPIPADASSLRYRLVKVISKTADKTLAITDIWLVEKVGEYEKPKGMGDKSLTFEFNASERRMFGFSGCNTLRGPITKLTETELEFGNLASTMMACGQANMELERAVSNAFSQTKKYKRDGMLLTLIGAGNEVLMVLRKVD